MKQLYVLINMFVCAVCMMACSDKNKEQSSTIDTSLTNYVDSLLLTTMDSLQADSGIVIVVNTESGQVRAICGGFRAPKEKRQVYCYSEHSSVGQIATLLAALETGKLHLIDTVDTGLGYLNIHDRMLKDHSWRVGGFGRLTYEQAFLKRSNIAVYKAATTAFGENMDSLFAAYARIGYKLQKPKSKVAANAEFAWNAIGYGEPITAMDALEFVNAIANNGKQIALTSSNGTTNVTKEQIASAENIKAVRSLFENEDSYIRMNLQKGLSTGLIGSTIQLTDSSNATRYKAEYFGYIPAKQPRYTIYIGLYKKQLPFSAVRLAGVYEQLAKHLLNQ